MRSQERLQICIPKLLNAYDRTRSKCVSDGYDNRNGSEQSSAHHVTDVKKDGERDQQQAEVKTMGVGLRRMHGTKVLQQDKGELNQPKDHQLLVHLVHHGDVGWAGFRLRSDGWSGINVVEQGRWTHWAGASAHFPR